MVLAFVFFVACCLVFRFIRFRLWPLLAATLVINLVCICLWLALDGVSGNGLDASVIYHMSTGLEGVGLADYEGYIVKWISILVLSAVALSLLLKYLSSRWPRPRYGNFLLALSFSGLFLNPLLVDGYGQYSQLRAFAEGLEFNVNENPGLGELENLFAIPSADDLESLKKNIVFIYLEGLESNYFDTNTFGELAPNLRELSKKAVRFTGIEMPLFARWTTAGIVASQCGVPLIPLGNANVNDLRGFDQFLPGATCIGDLLPKAGYHTEYIGGASLTFAGKGDFLATHGYKKRWGVEELRKQLPRDTPRVVWGYNDDVVFDFAEQRFIDLYEKESPFLLSVLSLDTHPPSGFISPECIRKGLTQGDDSILDAVRCTDYIASRLIRSILKHDQAKNTIVVVMSDHLAHPNSQRNKLEAIEPRNLLFWVFDGSSETGHEISKPGNSYDVGATVLAMAGSKSSRLGFGVDLLGHRNSTISDALIEDNLQQLSGFFWRPVDLEGELKILAEQPSLKWSGRTFSLPLSVTFNESYSAESLYWQTPLNSLLVRLTRPNSMIIDSCGWIDEGSESEWCLYYHDRKGEYSWEYFPEPGVSGVHIKSRLSGTAKANPWSFNKQINIVSSGGPKGFSGMFYGGEEKAFQRGLNLVRIDAEGVEMVATYDPCGKKSDKADAAEFVSLSKRASGTTLLAVKGTLGCAGRGHTELSGLLDAKVLQSLKPGQPYVGIIDGKGRALMEKSGSRGKRVRHRLAMPATG